MLKNAPPGCRLLNACGAAPLIRALSSSTHHITSLIHTDPLRWPVIPGHRAASLPVRWSYMHSPTARVFDVPSLIAVMVTLLFWYITPPLSRSGVNAPKVIGPATAR